MWKMTIPMVFAMMAMVLFNIVDTIYVGQLGTDELAAISFTFPVVFFFASIMGGLGMGATSIISRTLGAGDKERAARLTTDSLLLAITVAIISMSVGLATIDPLFRALNVNAKLFPMVKSYMEIWYFGIPAVAIPMVGNAIIRATGDTKIPMKIMLFAVFVNIILDPLLIFGIGPFPRMGIRGAAVATVSARVITMFLSIYVLVRVKKLIKWKLPTFKELKESWKDVLHVGAPNAFVSALTPASLGLVTGIISYTVGVTAVAGYGSATRLEAFVIMPIIAFCTALVPFVGQNYGSGKQQRVRDSISLGHRAVLAYGLIVFTIFAVTAPLSARMFSSDPEVIRNYCYYIWLGGLGWMGLSICYIVTNSFNALGKPLPATVITVIRVFVLILPFVLVGGIFMGAKGAFVGMAIANGLAGILAFVWLEKVMRK
jgi:putative MATE family efflux protein